MRSYIHFPAVTGEVLEGKVDECQLSVVVRHSYDSLDRTRRINNLHELGVQAKVLRPLKSTGINTTASVKLQVQ